MRLVRAAMAEAIVALDDLLHTEDPSHPTRRALVLNPARAESFAETRLGLRKVYGAGRGDFDRLKRSGPIARAHFLEQAEARMGRTLSAPRQPPRTIANEG